MTLLASLLGVLLIFSTRTSSQEDSVEQLKLAMSNELAIHQHKFVVSFFGINPGQLLCPKNSNQRYMTFASNYRSKINESIGRYSQLYSIVFANFSFIHKYIENTFREFALRPNNVFIFIIDCRYVDTSCKSPIIPWYVYNCPAIKIPVFPRSYTKTKELMGGVWSPDYFKFSKVPISHIINSGLLASSIEFHKKHFWNGNLKNIFVEVEYNNLEYFQKCLNNIHVCFEIAMNHKFDDSNEYDIELLALIYFAQFHNLTLNVDDDPEYLYHKQLIGSSANYFESHEMPSYMRTGLELSHRYSQKVIYCPSTNVSSKSHFDYSVWIEPFPLNVWIMFIVLFILVPYVMFAKGVGNKLEGILALLS